MHTTAKIEINGHHHEVRQATVTGAHVKALGHHEHGTLFRIEANGRRRIADDETVDVRDGGRFVVEQRERREHVVIVVDETRYRASDDEMSGAAIKNLACRPPANRLYRLDGNQRVRVEDTQTVRLHDGEEFITLPPIGHASR